jgi:HD-GYP domain-containing protein (c-di-GMP phosphodiesterase class II)
LNPFDEISGSEVTGLVEHGIRTAGVAVAVAHALDLAHDVIGDIDIAARLHDIGKIHIDAAILNKPGPLNAREWKELRHHPQRGYEMVRTQVNDRIGKMVLMHHERLDGEGYPNGLTADSIEMPLRILHVADAFDAITSHRPYQRAMPVAHAISELTSNIGTQFDADAVRALISLVSTARGMSLVDDDGRLAAAV